MAGAMEPLGARGHRQVVANERSLRGPAKRSIEDRAERWWDIPAKIGVARRVYDEELERSMAEAKAAGLSGAGDNRFDALRHARASRRITDVAGPRFAEAAGAYHEGENVVKDLIPAFAAQGVGRSY